jgi:signal transduction histidine kinase/ActR/RegA family two-component response regulator
MMPSTSRAALARVARDLGIELDAERHELVAQEQLRMVLSHTRFGTLVATAFALLLALYLPAALPSVLVQSWVAAKLLVAAARIAAAHWHATRGQPADARWRRLTYVLLALDGAVWGVAGGWLMTGAQSLAALVAAALACVSCVATFGLQVRTVATAAYVTPMLVPTALALVLRGDDFGFIGGVGLLMLLALQLATARGAEQRLAIGVLLRLQAQRLAAEKDAALRLAQHQSAVKSQFLAKLSHELRTPLHGILGLARLLHADARDEASRHRVELIEASGRHLLSLINDLLDASRIESGRFTLRPERFELVAEFEQVAELFAQRAADKGLQMEVQAVMVRPHWVHGDPARWRQVLHNLLGNALKFTSRGAIVLTLDRGDGPDGVRVSVRDSGVGIASTDLDRVFDAFEQSDAGTTGAREGAGLGLTIAREIAREMGGDIRARSRLGEGSTFVFEARLPAAQAKMQTQVDPEARALPAAAAVSPLPRRVLVAEDDDVNAMIVGAYLGQLGIAAERVVDGREAVRRALCQTDRPDLVLMDCRMPEMDGLDATREIRLEERRLGLPRLPVVALTATATESERALCQAAGMDDFVAKPFTMDELTRALQRWAAAR